MSEKPNIQNDYNDTTTTTNIASSIWYPASPSISLTLSEFETLRELVKGNTKAKAVLNKFAPYIVLRVDF